MNIARNMCTNAYSQIVSMFVMLLISLQTILFLKKILFVLKKYSVISNFWKGNGHGKLLEINYICLHISSNLPYIEQSGKWPAKGRKM